MSELRTSLIAPLRAPVSWRGTGWSMWAPALAVGAILALLVLPPIGILIDTSLRVEDGDGPLTLSNYAMLLADRQLYSSAWNSAVFSLGATLLSLLLGGVLAWIVERTNAPLKSLALVTSIVSLGTPYILYVGAWLFLLGRVGPLNDSWRRLTGDTELLFNVFSLPGMILVEGVLWSPLVFLLMSATFRRSNADMEEAARMCGASVASTVWRISVQLARPAIIGLGLFVFIRNLESFDVPVLIGMPGRINLLTTDVYLSIRQIPPQMGHASAFSVVLLGVVAVLLYFYGRISHNADRYASITGKGYRPRPFDLGRGRWLGAGFIVFNFLIVLLLPMASIIWTSIMPFARPMTAAAVPLATIRHYVAVLTQSSYGGLILNTFMVSALAATAVMLLTVIAAWLAVRRWPGAALLDQLASMPIIFPGIVLGVAMLEIALRAPFPLYNTLWLIALAFLVRYLPYGMRYSYSGALQIHRELEEAAGVAGAGQPTILRRIVAPMMAPAVIAGWLFIFLIGAKELSISVLLAGAGTQTMAVAMFDQLGNGRGGEAAALGALWTLVMTMVASVLHLVTRRQTRNMAAG